MADTIEKDSELTKTKEIEGFRCDLSVAKPFDYDEESSLDLGAIEKDMRELQKHLERGITVIERKDMKPKLKIRLEKWEKALVFQVLEMDERFRSTADESKEFKSSKLIVKSVYNPSICAVIDGFICLWGSNRELDLRASIVAFDSNEERDVYYENIITSIKEWVEGWEGWKEEAAKEEPQEGIIVF